jgi:hypothetical protein
MLLCVSRHAAIAEPQIPRAMVDWFVHKSAGTRMMAEQCARVHQHKSVGDP